MRTAEYLNGHVEEQRRLDALYAANETHMQAMKDFEDLARPHGFR